MEVYFESRLNGRLKSNSSSAFLGVTSAVINEDKNDTKPNDTVITNVNNESAAEKAGLKKDDIITEINGKVVNNTNEARELLKPEENKNNYTIKSKRNGTPMSFEVKIPKKIKNSKLINSKAN